MKCQLLIILIITLITHSLQLLKRTAKVETKINSENDKESLEVKVSLTNLKNNNINSNDGRSTNPPKEKVWIKYI